MLLSVVLGSIHDAQPFFFDPVPLPGTSGSPQSSLMESAEILHCLTEVELNWLGDWPSALEKATTFHVGLTHDRKTYPGQDVIIVVVFRNRLRGDVFELTGERRRHKSKYNLENNGSFKIVHKEFTWPNEIFGGIWTHEYIEKNIRKIMRGRKIWIRLKTAQKLMPTVGCTWYGSN